MTNAQARFEWFRPLWAGLRLWAVRTSLRSVWSIRRLVNGRRFKAVLLTSHYAAYKGEYDRPVTIWGVNFAYRKTPDVNRIYAMDHISDWRDKNPEWIDQVNALDVPVVMQDRYEDVPHSTPFDLTRAVRMLPVPDYYVNSISYMLLDAIMEGFGTIVVHRILSSVGSIEYIEQKACLDYWAGVAAGLGINVVTSADSMIGRPYPWQTNLYGYIDQKTWSHAASIMSKAAMDACRLPRRYRVPGAEDKRGIEHLAGEPVTIIAGDKAA